MKKYTLKNMLWMLLLGASITSCRGVQTHSEENGTNVPFIANLEIPKFTKSHIPCIPVQIEGKSVLMKIDLGFDGWVLSCQDFLEIIPEKKFLRKVKNMGMRGTVWEKDMYEVPLIRMANITYFNFPIEEEAELFGKESSLEEGPKEREAGSLGWRLFDQLKVLFDIPSNKIIACENLTEIEKQGYALKEFIKTPLCPDEQILSIESATSKGPLRWMLDTGATANHLNGGSGYNLESRVDNIFLQIEGKNFGPISAYEIPFKFLLPVDGILGMEFFENNLVLIDFPERQVYFLPLEKAEEVVSE